MKPTHCLPLCIFVLLPAPLFGHGLLLIDQDAAATARGNAFVATADNPSALYYNPAGITQLDGQQLRLGAYSLTYQTDYLSLAGAASKSTRAYETLPQIYYTFSSSKYPVSFGIGVYSPFGLSMKWPENSGFRSAALDGSVQYFTVQPVIAYRLIGNRATAAPRSAGDAKGTAEKERSSFTPDLSLAIGPTLNYARTDLKQGLSQFVGNDYFRFKGDAFAVGFSAGLRWQPVKQHAFGITYRSATKMEYSGHTETVSFASGLSLRQDAKAEFEFPQSVTLGWSWRPTPEWNVEFNANWTDWSSFDTVQIKQATSTVPLALNWRSSWYFAWGVTRKFEGGWRASAGYIYSQNSVPDGNFTPLVPDTDRHAGSIGIGRDMGKWSWDVAYQLTRGTGRTVNGSASAVADGRYDWWSHALAVSVGLKF
jgi:long-chain fatty acid transport protein